MLEVSELNHWFWNIYVVNSCRYNSFYVAFIFQVHETSVNGDYLCQKPSKLYNNLTLFFSEEIGLTSRKPWSHTSIHSNSNCGDKTRIKCSYKHKQDSQREYIIQVHTEFAIHYIYYILLQWERSTAQNTTCVVQRLALWTLEKNVSDAIPGRNHLGNWLFYVFWVVTQGLISLHWFSKHYRPWSGWIPPSIQNTAVPLR